MRILVLDNKDSFTYNLAHYIHDITGTKPDVIRNDVFDLSTINNYDGVMLSPGPGLPEEAGIMLPLIVALKPTIPLLGVCLGMQAIAIHHGCRLSNLKKVRHGVSTELILKNDVDILFNDIPVPVKAGSYHSWVIDKKTISNQIIVTATDDTGEIMAIRHATLPHHGIQVHPESIMTDHGNKIIENWISTIRI
jgi:anthranilate synthase component II